MSRYWSDFHEENKYYTDGITMIVDPFWVNICRKCGEKFWSCDSICECPSCGNTDIDRWLDGVPYDQVVAERSKPKENQNKSV